MEKVLVEIFVPVLDRSFDVFIPLQSPMYEVLELIKKAISEMSDGRFIANQNTTICQFSILTCQFMSWKFATAQN